MASCCKTKWPPYHDSEVKRRSFTSPLLLGKKYRFENKMTTISHFKGEMRVIYIFLIIGPRVKECKKKLPHDMRLFSECWILPLSSGWRPSWVIMLKRPFICLMINPRALKCENNSQEIFAWKSFPKCLIWPLTLASGSSWVMLLNRPYISLVVGPWLQIVFSRSHPYHIYLTFMYPAMVGFHWFFHSFYKIFAKRLPETGLNRTPHVYRNESVVFRKGKWTSALKRVCEAIIWQGITSHIFRHRGRGLRCNGNLTYTEDPSQMGKVIWLNSHMTSVKCFYYLCRFI